MQNTEAEMKKSSDKSYFIFLCFILGVLGFIYVHNSFQSSSKIRTRQAGVPQFSHPTNICRTFYTPYMETDRNKYSTLMRRLISRYGDYRSSPRRGHRHAGIDLRGDFNELVYPVGVGQVVDIFRSFPHKTIVIKHYLDGNHFRYSVYTHVEDIRVKVGDWVNENTALARLFDEDELIASDFGTLNHVHLEIRKSINDNGRASWTSMNMPDLNKFCVDPLEFFAAFLVKDKS
jgi:murein DD-endopeptidase MepM/ murein hydrolase activator NlpD